MIENSEVTAAFDSFPAPMRKKLMYLRQLILETAAETKAVGSVEETLKWGEPAYLTKTGSTIRIATTKDSDKYAMYFHCKTKLIDTFKELYSGRLSFEGNRAIVFTIRDELPIEEIKHCIALSLTYHQV